MRSSFWTASAAAVAIMAGAHAAQADKANDSMTIAWGGTGSVEHLDNYVNTARTGIWISRMLWDGLVFRDPVTFEYKPNLAESWEEIDDTTIEFKLREGVKFHNGEPFDADDVVYTLNWIANPENGVKVQSNVNWIDRAEKIDQYTVRVYKKKPFPQAFEYLAGPVVIYPNEYYAEVGPDGMNKNPVGTGPYKLVSQVPFEEYVFERNEDFTWGSPKGMAKIGKVVARDIKDVQTQVAELLGGGIDWTADVSADHVDQIDKVPGFEGVQAETMRTGYLGFDAAGRSGVEAMTNVKVRKAIAHAVNRKALVDNLIRGNSRVIDTPCFPTQFGCIQDAAVRYEYDQEKAKQLLAEAGYPDGFEVDLYTYRPADWAEAIMADLAKVGIRAKLTRMPYFAVRDTQREGKTPMYLMDWGSYSINDASAIISNFFKLGPDDMARDEEVKAWLDIADTSNDPEVRKEHYAKVIEKITDQVYWLPMFTHVRNYAFVEDLQFDPPADEIPRFFQFSWE